MKQTYHSNATTNIRIGSEIYKSNLSYSKLSEHHGVLENTIRKWKNRTNFEDKSLRPHTIKYSLNEMNGIIALKIRTLTWLSLDEITEALNPEDPPKDKKCRLQNLC